MNYSVITLNGKEYKARLDLKGVVQLEDKLNKSYMSILTEMMDGKSLPKVGDLLVTLHQSLQALEHGISLEDVYVMWTKEVENGKSIADLIQLIIKIYEDSGLIQMPNNE